MEITAISGIDTSWAEEYTMKTVQPVQGAAFVDIFTSAIENVKTTDNEKNEMEYLLSVGELDNPAQLTIAATKAQMAVDLLVELRNKALEAHSEISKMAI